MVYLQDYSNQQQPSTESIICLPGRYRITFKILLLVPKDLNGLTPQYITDLLSVCNPIRLLQSATADLFLELDVSVLRRLSLTMDLL